MHNEKLHNVTTELLNFSQTGLPGLVWYTNGFNQRYEPRIKISYHGETDFNKAPSVTINGRIRIIGNHFLSHSQFRDIKKWILLNREQLNNFWFDDSMSTPDLLLNIIPLPHTIQTR